MNPTLEHHTHYHHTHIPLAELHTHLGGAVDPAILWTIAHEQGIKLPTKDYWEFERLVTVSKDEKLEGMKMLDSTKYHWTELIQSSPLAIEPAVHGTLGGAYRANHIVLHELRYNPMKRNRGGEQDLDHIIMATIRGMEKALLEYPEIRAGLIIILDRTLPFRLNEILYQKALKYRPRGIIGIDLAGPPCDSFRMEDYVDLLREAKSKGLGLTIHTGEEGAEQLKEMELVVEKIEPDRIGHGFLAWQNEKLVKQLVEKKITLELCPTSNLQIQVIKSEEEMKKIYRSLYDSGVILTINTDGPEMHGTTLWKEFNFLLEKQIFAKDELNSLIQNAFDSTFVR